MTEPIISFKDFSFQYHSQATPTLQKINVDIYPGSIFDSIISLFNMILILIYLLPIPYDSHGDLIQFNRFDHTLHCDDF